MKYCLFRNPNSTDKCQNYKTGRRDLNSNPKRVWI